MVLDHAFDYAQVEYCAIEYCFFNTKKPCNSPQGYLAFFPSRSRHVTRSIKGTQQSDEKFIA